jgi:hypothetical protein
MSVNDIGLLVGMFYGLFWVMLVMYASIGGK